MASEITVLDCTLRDGGYYNSWDFRLDLVQDYLAAAKAVGVDYVEIGFRFIGHNRFLGPFAYSRDSFLASLDTSGIRLGVMVNAKDVLTGDLEQTLALLFNDAKDSPVELVRIAAHMGEVEACAPMVRRLSAMGYRIGFNIMQVGGKSPDEIRRLAKVVAGLPVEVLYFADSLGNMQPAEVTTIVGAMKEGFGGPIGFHAHDNMGQALANAMAALEAGVTWIDATVLGMGRGAGNLRMDYLLLELIRQGRKEGPVERLSRLQLPGFAKLQAEYQWGSNIYYYLSGVYGIHPTYVQEMLGDSRYGADSIFSALEFLREADGHSYSAARLRQALNGGNTNFHGSWDATGWAEGRTVLIIGPGEAAREHLAGLVAYVRERKPVVLALNLNRWFPAELVTAWTACNQARLLMDAPLYVDLKAPLIAPARAIPDSVRNHMHGVDLLDFGLAIDSETMAISKDGCTLPQPLVALYSLAVANAIGAKRILLAGFDGYDHGDPRQAEMAHGLALYARIPGAAPVVAVTPTTYPIEQGSIYAPDI